VYPAMCLAGKLVGPARLNPVAAGQLAHMLDQASGRHFLVDTGSSFSILPFSSSSPATGPSLTGPAGEAIPCWGEAPLSVNFDGELFQWTFLKAAVQFPILGVDFLHGHRQRTAWCRKPLAGGSSCRPAPVVPQRRW
jgi:hypothetical protein